MMAPSLLREGSGSGETKVPIMVRYFNFITETAKGGNHQFHALDRKVVWESIGSGGPEPPLAPP
jgi:hypothetical protein